MLTMPNWCKRKRPLKLLVILVVAAQACFLVYILNHLLRPVSRLLGNDEYDDDDYDLPKLNQTRQLRQIRRLVLTSPCACRQHELVVVEPLNASHASVTLTNQRANTNTTTTSHLHTELTTITCDLHSALRRGAHQRVIGLSLYGHDAHYTSKLLHIAAQVKAAYPHWLIRVYHDTSINASLACHLQCRRDNVDFCRVDHVPLTLGHHADGIVLDATYMHAMKWRWLPLGDSLVDVFASRDADSYVVAREVDAVRAWLNSGRRGHIMRDHRMHGFEILGGMWGVRMTDAEGRRLARRIFRRMVSWRIARRYVVEGAMAKGWDQYFLRDHVYGLLRREALVHDSFHCGRFGDAVPWPSRRRGNCFVGSNLAHACDPTAEFDACPVECRPAGHVDWTSC